MTPNQYGKIYIVAGVVAVLLIVLFWHKDASQGIALLDGVSMNTEKQEKE